VAHCNNTICDSVSTTDIDPGDGSRYIVGYKPSLRIGADGLALISYGEEFRTGSVSAVGIRVAHCLNVACTPATTTRLPPRPSLARESALTIGGDSLGQVAFVEQPHSDDGGAWRDWASIDGTLSNVVVEANGNGLLELFGVNSSFQMFHRWQTSPGG